MSPDTSRRDELAELAVEPVHGEMVVGLGTGRAASRGIHALAAKVQREGIEVTCVATSRRSAELAQSLGLTVVPMRDIERIDLLFDGVDELDPNMAMLKGAGGAMTREKIVADAADLRIYMLDHSKVVDHLGLRFPLPVEVLEFAQSAVEHRLRDMGFDPRLRLNEDRSDYRTDDGNLVIDGAWPPPDERGLHDIADRIDLIPGVVGHGLFVDHADVALIESEDGRDVEERVRPAIRWREPA